MTVSDIAKKYLNKNKTFDLDSELMQLYEAKFEEINSHYQAGGLEYIEKHYPGLCIAIQRAEDQLNMIWDRCGDVVGKIEDFKKALSKWAKLNIKGIECYRKNGGNNGKRI